MPGVGDGDEGDSSREGAFSVFALGVLAPGLEEAVPVAVKALVSAMQPWSAPTTLLNWLGAADADEVARAWTPENYHRLLALKRQLDPTDMIRFGHAVRVGS